jgi:uncharacterized small protein (DUF1192 family)
MGELVANYETQIAILRAEITILMQEKEQKEESINQYNQELASKISEVN